MNQPIKNHTINNVSDTSFWVAAYRAMENERPDALFKDPYASILTEEKGKEFVNNSSDSTYVNWTIIIRTCVIDKMIQSILSNGIDTIINLGAGLDTRPYRMELPDSLNWIEVDHENIINYKEKKLNGEIPNCKLSRVPLDLLNQNLRRNLFEKLNMKSNNILIITEGVIPYFTPEDVSSLAFDLYEQSAFKLWITEFHSQMMYKHLGNKRKNKEMGSSPFKFFPSDWTAFFHDRRWQTKEIVYLIEEAEKLGRVFPTPWWAKVLHKITPPKELEKFRKMLGFQILYKET